jgi:hypothetical protein
VSTCVRHCSGSRSVSFMCVCVLLCPVSSQSFTVPIGYFLCLHHGRPSTVGCIILLLDHWMGSGARYLRSSDAGTCMRGGGYLICTDVVTLQTILKLMLLTLLRNSEHYSRKRETVSAKWREEQKLIERDTLSNCKWFVKSKREIDTHKRYRFYYSMMHYQLIKSYLFLCILFVCFSISFL